MRVKEPLNGFLRSMGNVIFHIALLVGSFVIMHGPNKHVDKTEKRKIAEADNIINIIRWMHAYVTLSKMIRTYLYNEENRLLIRFIRIIAFGVYFICFLYLQY